MESSFPLLILQIQFIRTCDTLSEARLPFVALLLRRSLQSQTGLDAEGGSFFTDNFQTQFGNIQLGALEKHHAAIVPLLSGVH
jgi:hypothetical protein